MTQTHERRDSEPSDRRRNRLESFVSERARAGVLVVQPRMGFTDPGKMRAGLTAVFTLPPSTVGTLTVDSYTRVNDHRRAARAISRGEELNGYPLVAHGASTTRQVVEGLLSEDFPVQVRHGSALPQQLVKVMVAAGLDATEGGPVSYCLPYSRVRLRDSIDDWARTCRILAEGERGRACHLESFGGCMLGQLCPPSLLVALTVLECLFARQHGVRSVSVSYAQQTHSGQDLTALLALRELAGDYLSDTSWHLVLYTFMGLFPRTPRGARAILRGSARLAVTGGADRLIVKTTAEAHRIPSVAENLAALRIADDEARKHAANPVVLAGRATSLADIRDSDVYRQARFLIDLVCDLHADVGEGLLRAFERGLLDVPYCLHPDNRNAARCAVGADGRLRWADTGAIPFPRNMVDAMAGVGERVGSRDLLRMLAYNQNRFDSPRSGEPSVSELGNDRSRRPFTALY